MPLQIHYVSRGREGVVSTAPYLDLARDLQLLYLRASTSTTAVVVVQYDQYLPRALRRTQ